MGKNIAVIGAGPAGLTAAWKLAQLGHEVTLFEMSNRVGGMAASIDLWGQRVDLGPHRFFSNDPRINKVWMELLAGKYKMVQRTTRIFYKKKFFHYPLQAWNALWNLGPIASTHCVLSYLKARAFPPKSTATFEDWVVSRFGRRLFEIFFKSYSEKLWGISCKDLDADFAAQRIKKFSMMEAIKSAFGIGKEKHKTLVDEFAYPHDGAGALYEAMAESFQQHGGKIFFGEKVERVVHRDDGVSLLLASGLLIDFDHVISSMPMTDLVLRMNPPQKIAEHCSRLTFRNTMLVFLRVDAPVHFKDQWIYVHSPDLKTGRITHFGNWVPEIQRGQKETILCMEYWCNNEDEEWSWSDDTWCNLAIREMEATGLIPKGSVSQAKPIRVPKCYPVYSTGYKKDLKPVESYLSQFSRLTVIGRYGSFKYNNQDHSILMGLLASENIHGSANHKLFDVNTDTEYQESCRITATGLQMETSK